MTLARVKSQSRMHWTTVGIALAGLVLFQFFGNAARGYVDTGSLLWWWISQWIDPQAETEHGWLVLGLSAWLGWRNVRRTEAEERTLGSQRLDSESAETRRTHRVQAGGSDANGVKRFRSFESRWASWGVMLVALILHGLGFVAQQSRISIIAFLLFCWAVIALANRRWARAASFPLGFMVFAIPLNVLDSVGFWLRMGVIDASETFARVAGIEVVRSGTQLFAPDGRFQYDVAAACSGVRSLMALAALSLLIGYLNFRSTARRALMLLLCFPLTYVGNVARVALIIVAAQAGGQRWGAWVHDVMGYGIFVIVLGGVLASSALVRRFWPERDEAQRVRTVSATDDSEKVSFEAQQPSGAALIGRWAVMVLIVGEIFFLAHISSVLSRGGAGVRLNASGSNPIDLPAFIGTEWIGRQTEVSAVERSILPADTGFSRRTYVSVNDRSHGVFLSIVLSGSDRTSIHRPELCLVGQGWTVTRASAHDFTWPDDRGASVPATLLRTTLIEPVAHRKIEALMAYWFVSSDAVVATHWQRFLHDAWSRVRHGRVDRWAYVLIQADAHDGEAAALLRMQAVLDATLPIFQRVGGQ